MVKKKKKAGHYMIIEGSIHQEDMATVQIYALNIGALKYIKKN